MLLLLPLLPLLARVRAETSTPNTGDQTNGFLFDYVRSYNAPLPMTESCPSALTFAPVTVPFGGAEPAPPYTAMFLINEAYLGDNGTVESRTYTYSTSFNDGRVNNAVNLPLMNGTQFMVCMWAANGIAGGCQDLYNIYASPNYSDAYATNESSCRGDVEGSWYPVPERRLQVDVFGENGVVAERAWPASCSDLRFTPKNGIAPYTLIISPAMHPPVNITSNSTFASDNSMNYTIRLTHGMPFFATIFDDNGASWSSGPYHAGTNQNVGCLATLTGQEFVGGQMPDTAPSSGRSGGVSVGALAGGIAGAFVVGAVLAGLVMFLLAKRKKRSNHTRNNSTDSLDGYHDTRPATWRSDTHASIAKPSAVTPYTDQSPFPDMDQGSHILPYGENPSSPRSQRLSMAQLEQTQSMDGHDRAYRQSVGLGDFQPASSGRAPGSSVSGPSEHGGGPGPGSPPLGQSSSVGNNGRQVYVVHSDGGGNVHITLPEGGASVVELPPNYQNSGNTSSSNAGPSNRPEGAEASSTPRDEKSRFQF